MDELDKFFDFSKPFKQEKVSCGSTGGKIKVEPKKFSQPGEIQPRNLDKTTKYAQHFESDLNKDMIKRFVRKRRHSEEEEDSDISVYNEYDFQYRAKPNQRLPIMNHRRQILTDIYENPVVIIQGSTGCGKTTQVPQFILDDAYNQRKRCFIIVAQPRRIAAATNAKRVCEERGWDLPSIVGYQVGMDEQANVGPDTRLLYCTTGILLEKIIRTKSLKPFTHIILDEVHERSKEMDFLFVVIRKLQTSKERVILMSATINSEPFSLYFKTPSERGEPVAAPVITVDGGTIYQTQTYYLDDLERVFGPGNEGKPELKINDPKINEDMYRWALKLIVSFERIDAIESRKLSIDRKKYKNSPKPTVLIFLPGIHEIEEMYKTLEKWRALNKETEIIRIILHSAIPPLHTELAMQKTTTNARKIILATNIAESSITVPDVKYVIDFCRTRNLMTDRVSNFTSLRLNWACRTNCIQRAGRTGRTMNGKCFRLVTKHFYLNEMKETQPPELLTSPLENIILKAKVLDMGRPDEILGLAMDKPNLSDIGDTILLLKQIGALLRTKDGEVSYVDGDLSYIGRIMSNLPCDVRISKLIILGYCFSVLDDCIIIGSALNCSKSIFKYMPTDIVKSYAEKLQWTDGSGSDLVALLNAYNAWKILHSLVYTDCETIESVQQARKKEKLWADRYNLELAALYECDVLVNELNRRLLNLDIREQTGLTPIQISDNEKRIILKAVIAGAFYPNFFVRDTPDAYQYEQNAFRKISGRDPKATVYFTGFKRNFIRELYVKPIKEIFIRNNVCTNMNQMRVAFEDGAERVFVTFKNCKKENDKLKYGLGCLPGNILTQVYKSIKMRQAKLPNLINVDKNQKRSLKLAKERGLNICDERLTVIKGINGTNNDTCLPGILVKKLTGYITHVDYCGKFYFQPENESEMIQIFNKELNREDSDIEVIENIEEVNIGQVLAAPFSDDGLREDLEYFRGKIIDIDENKDLIEVFFMDFGNTEKCKLSDVRRFRGVSVGFMAIPPRCFECSLAQVQPSIINAPDGLWPIKANTLFRELTEGEKVEAEVYSVVDGVVRAFIRIIDEHDEEIVMDVAKELIKEKLAEYCEESLMSKSNNAKRYYAQRTQTSGNNIDEDIQKYLIEEAVPEVDPPPKEYCNHKIFLNGPHSPLETNVYPTAEAARAKTVTIDRTSLNCVLLGNDPQDASEKYLVAASITQGQDSSRLTIRQTTLMPNIRGFGPIIASIFCPKMEVQRDECKNRYVSLITGLGYDYEQKRPLFQEQDMVFNLDVELTCDDFTLINKIRFYLDTLLLTKPDPETERSLKSGSKYDIKNLLKTMLIKLLEKPRNSLERHSESANWNQYVDDVLDSKIHDKYGFQSIFPAHYLLKLHPLKLTNILNLIEKNTELHNLAKIDCDLRNRVKCLLCKQEIDNVPDLRIHLLSRVHIEREIQLELEN